PTLGRISRHGVIPITADQDTPGPMTKTVADAAIMLGVLEGKAVDPNDTATSRCERGTDYTQHLKRGGLKGARIGIPRAFFYDKLTLPGEKQPRGGLDAAQAKVMEEAIAILKQQGAIIVDSVDIPSITTTDSQENFLLWQVCSGYDNAKGKDAACSIVFKYGMKRDFNKWLASLGAVAPVKTLTELRQWNIAHQRAGALKYGQALLDISDEMNVETDAARYRADREKDLRLSATNGLDATMKKYQLDALLFPGPSSAGIAAKPGYPTVIVPFGLIPNAPTPPFPDAFAAKPTPYGVGFTGLACSEARLIELAYAFEQATKRRVPPPSAP
ncbi:MAG TPA: amidase family protein, partial [Blastocatellia bacterium]|nr:amidase family protein [Blastocatellia bacterium]